MLQAAKNTTVLCAKRAENGFFHTLGIISVILHALHTQDISHDPQSLLISRFHIYHPKATYFQ